MFNIFQSVLQSLFPIFSSRDWQIKNYRDDFEQIWSFDSTFIEQITNQNHVIVWDGSPVQSQYHAINLVNYLTVYDWAVTLELKLSQQGLTLPQPLLIIDLASQIYPESNSVKLMTDGLLRPLLSQVKIYTASELPEFVHELDLEPQKCDFKSNHQQLLKKIWSASLITPDQEANHHSISNLIGPLIINPSNKQLDPYLFALKQLMTSLALIPTTDSTQPGLTEKIETSAGRILLIDDMASYGWQTWLAQSLRSRQHPGIDRYQIDTIEDPKQIVARFENLSLLDYIEQRINRSQIGFESVWKFKNEELWAICLDLRLYAGKHLEEVQFFRRLLTIARALNQQKHLAWERFDDNQFQLIEDYANQTDVSESTYFICLSLFPRILASIDPTLPIIIFSSTGQAEIIKLLKPYGNILTGFEKPRFFGRTHQNIQQETIDQLKACLEQAEVIFRVREQLVALQQIEEPKHQKHEHLEIYLDESDPENSFQLGGVSIAYSDLEEVKNTSQTLIQQSPIGYDCYQTNKYGISYLPKRPNNPDEILNNLAGTVFNNKSVSFIDFKIENFSLWKFKSHLNQDLLYRQLLGLMLDFLLFAWIPLCHPCKSLSVYAATRAFVPEADRICKALIHQLKDALIFGFEIEFDDICSKFNQNIKPHKKRELLLRDFSEISENAQNLVKNFFPPLDTEQLRQLFINNIDSLVCIIQDQSQQVDLQFIQTKLNTFSNFYEQIPGLSIFFQAPSISQVHEQLLQPTKDAFQNLMQRLITKTENIARSADLTIPEQLIKQISQSINKSLEIKNLQQIISQCQNEVDFCLAAQTMSDKLINEFQLLGQNEVICSDLIESWEIFFCNSIEESKFKQNLENHQILDNLRFELDFASSIIIGFSDWMEKTLSQDSFKQSQSTQFTQTNIAFAFRAQMNADLLKTTDYMRGLREAVREKLSSQRGSFTDLLGLIQLNDNKRQSLSDDFKADVIQIWRSAHSQVLKCKFSNDKILTFVNSIPNLLKISPQQHKIEDLQNQHRIKLEEYFSHGGGLSSSHCDSFLSELNAQLEALKFEFKQTFVQSKIQQYHEKIKQILNTFVSQHKSIHLKSTEHQYLDDFLQNSLKSIEPDHLAQLLSDPTRDFEKALIGKITQNYDTYLKSYINQLISLKHRDHYGLRQLVRDDQTLTVSFSYPDLYPFIEERLQLPLSPEFDKHIPSILAAKAVKLYYPNGSEKSSKTDFEYWELPSQQHYLADWVISRPELLPETWKQNGICVAYTHSLLQLAQALRKIICGENLIALKHWFNARLGYDQEQARKQTDKTNEPTFELVGYLIKKGLKQLTGKEFVLLVQYVKSLEDQV